MTTTQNYCLIRGSHSFHVELEPTATGWRGRMIAEGAPWVTGDSQGAVEDALLALYGQYDEEEDLWHA